MGELRDNLPPASSASAGVLRHESLSGPINQQRCNGGEAFRAPYCETVTLGKYCLSSGVVPGSWAGNETLRDSDL